MQVWNQVYLPLGGVGWSALAAGAPIILFFVSLAVLRLKGHVAGALTLALALVIAIAVYGMPAERAFASAAYGFAYGLWPIAWIIVTAVFLYKIVVKSGQFDVIRSSIVALTDDQRLQMLLIGFSFGAFLEGAAGFGAPVAITAALLVGLGFNPLYAAGLCLIADTAPVAFGALGIPVIVAGQVSGLDPMAVGAMAGRQLPFLSFFLPFWLVFVMDGVKGVRETWPAALVAGGSFALVQFFTSNYIGPELPDVTSALASLVALASFLKVWRPLRAREAARAQRLVSAGGGALALGGMPGGLGGARATGGREPSPYSFAQIARAWSPFVVLTVMVTIWSMKPFKALFAKGGALAFTTLQFHVAHLDKLTQKMAPVVAYPTPVPAVFNWDLLAATGTAILLSAIVSMAILNVPARTGVRTFFEVLKDLKRPVLSIGLVLAFAFVENYSGMSTTLALLLAGTGAAFPFFSPLLGWIGVFLTGSDTSSNALFCSLQATTAQQIGVPSTLLVAANTTGGVAGKMISPQSIAVACAAVGLVGREADLFRFTLRHSLFFALVVGVMTCVQAYWLTGMIVH
ncbi:lactate permease LctP family transporter [Burkholderia pseudomallei]|uniref:lactate permease LctP family transporter n=1 Tax=Burkholderia pseudomallei TaxID=28450 RepID=UPI00052AAD29|nr:lactate permease LctP family transporter [Burkholderia pseudomallei]AIV56270.1 transporter, lactate permease family protein [Burkholderia pseudomallei MSHR2243]AIV69274.1 glycolate permease glcA [Burkholderia pseudomallei MSHR62]KGU68816.1 glycolate permease glcA [Burkholderia pseudomallei MSHR465J]KGW71941.1 transporter, lactate permease family protein [Burkholderia pseudomallei MSHR3458]KGX41016.1 transporter, lactate permease family protein [Burkholderia pseudomallei MSHR3709]